MRKYLMLLALAAACTTTTPPTTTPGPYGMSVTEEATVLRLEDRREFDPALAQQWLTHENSLHRARMALALARIGPHAFIDANANGAKDEGEVMAGVALLIAAAADPVYEVRRNVAFALGEIGDPTAVTSLLQLAKDREHADVAAEAIEALSKLNAAVPFASYAELTRDDREGVRTRAIRFLFRFGTDEAMTIAQRMLDSTGTVDRREGAYSLSRKAFAPARGRLELLLTDADTLTRSYAARALGLITDSASVAPLLAATSDAHPWVRTNSARSLVQISDKHDRALQTTGAAEDALRIVTMTSDADPGARLTAIETLGAYSRFNEPSKKRLMELAVSGGSVEREIATGAVAKYHGIDALGALLQTDSSWMKVRALEGSASKGWAPQLRAGLINDPLPTVRAMALGGLGEEPSEVELAALRKALDDEDVIVRATAVERFAALKNVPVSEKVARLREVETATRRDLLNDARVAVITALAALDFPERESYLRERVNDRDLVIRRLAAEAIATQLKKPRPQYTPLPVERPMAEYEEIVTWARDPHTATIHLGRGKIQIVLATFDAPITAWNFATLAKKGYFDNTSFMRVVPNFVIQGGDPRNDMNGGPGYSIRDEMNLQKYTRGAVGMALSGPDTGGSQFFVTHSPQHHLDGGYTIFGRVVDGMGGVVDQVERGDKVEKITIDEYKNDKPDFQAVQNTPLPTIIGRVTREQLVSILPEYEALKTAYTPDRDVIEMMATSVQPSDRVEVVLGTWCTDSQREVPKLFRIVDTLKSDFGVEVPMSFVAINRAKKEPAELIAGKSIDKVATFIVYRGEQELGRIVEVPTTLFEDDLLQIFAK